MVCVGWGFHGQGAADQLRGHQRAEGGPPPWPRKPFVHVCSVHSALMARAVGVWHPEVHSAYKVGLLPSLPYTSAACTAYESGLQRMVLLILRLGQGLDDQACRVRLTSCVASSVRKVGFLQPGRSPAGRQRASPARPVPPGLDRAAHGAEARQSVSRSQGRGSPRQHRV